MHLQVGPASPGRYEWAWLSAVMAQSAGSPQGRLDHERISDVCGGRHQDFGGRAVLRWQSFRELGIRQMRGGFTQSLLRAVDLRLVGNLGLHSKDLEVLVFKLVVVWTAPPNVCDGDAIRAAFKMQLCRAQEHFRQGIRLREWRVVECRARMAGHDQAGRYAIKFAIGMKDLLPALKRGPAPWSARCYATRCFRAPNSA